MYEDPTPEIMFIKWARWRVNKSNLPLQDTNSRGFNELDFFKHKKGPHVVAYAHRGGLTLQPDSFLATWVPFGNRTPRSHGRGARIQKGHNAREPAITR